MPGTEKKKAQDRDRMQRNRAKQTAAIKLLVEENNKLRGLLTEADKLTIWEMTSVPEGFQERVEEALGL